MSPVSIKVDPKVPDIVSLIRFSRTQIFIKNIVLNMVHDHMVQSVKTRRDTKEWANDKVKQVFANHVPWLLEQGSVFRVVHH